MPARPRNAGPTIYLDHSHLMEAFKGRSGASAAGSSARLLADCIEMVARNANLVLSTVHVLELSLWDDRRVIDWLDSLEVVWAWSKDHVEREEEERCVKSCVGLRPAVISPFASSLVAALDDVRDGDLPAMAGEASLINFVETARSVPQTPWRTSLQANLAMIRQDRLEADRAGMSADERARRLQKNRRDDLEARALAAHERLRRQPAYVARAGSKRSVVRSFVRRVERRATSLPSYSIVSTHVRSLLDVGAMRKAGSRKEQKLLSAPLDVLHAAVGGAYCDVFSCDREANAWLGDARQQLGRERQISNLDEIIERLREFC